MNPILLNLPNQLLTPRLLLRPPMPGDGPIINEAVCESIEYLREWLPWAVHFPSIDDSEEHARRTYARWLLREDLGILIFDRENGRLLGGSGLHRINWTIRAFEIGYWVRESEQGRGFITESANALTRFAFSFLNAVRVEIRCETRNAKSAAIPQRLGFELEGILRNQIADTQGRPQDTSIYSRQNLDGMPPLEVNW